MIWANLPSFKGSFYGTRSEPRCARCVFEAFGPPSVLRLVDLPDPEASDGFAVVRVTAASINPSDVKNARAMEGPALPADPWSRLRRRRRARSALEWLGREVFGTGGDIGFTVDGSRAEAIVLPVSALTSKPGRMSAAQAASVGVTSVVAWLGLIEYAEARARRKRGNHRGRRGRRHGGRSTSALAQN